MLGGGPSLTLGAGLRRLEGGCDRDGRPLAIIAVNDAYRVAPQADVCYFADGRWYSWHKDRPEFRSFAGLKVTIDGSQGEGDGPELLRLRKADLEVLSRDPARLALGGLGGYQAINLAFLAGARRIVLLGFDMQHRGGKANWHAGHPVKSPLRYLQQRKAEFRRLADELRSERVEVINASEETALEAFERRPIAEILPLPEEGEPWLGPNHPGNGDRT